MTKNNFAQEFSDAIKPVVNRDLQQKSSFSETLGTLIGIGGAIGGVLYGLTNEMPSFGAGLSAKFDQLTEDSKAAFNTATKQFNANMDAFGSKLEEGQVSGLSARGITDKAVEAETRTAVKQNVSSARAAAALALQKAQMEAQGRMSSAMANYYTNLTEKQYQASMAKYGAEQGLWGALGGASGALLALDSTPKVEAQKEAPKLTPDVNQSYTKQLLTENATIQNTSNEWSNPYIKNIPTNIEVK